ncbi:MAG: U32 family peptidase [Fusobacteria bacterium]|nr:U32 family peptidase [Fusobacteriota bacterium]
MIKHIELLAPAGGYDQLKAAVYSGADAIYFGGSRFSARSKANNFTVDEIIKARRLTNKYNVKMYCAINTLIKDDEIEDALNYIGFIYKIGIDAFIIQDLGLLKLVLEYFPDIEIHSSTQLSIQNSYGLKLLKNLGIKRAVIPREVSFKDIQSLAKEGIELEMFVHGAICISFSGQCLMSSMIGGRSGNRGSCAQPCRLKYDLIDYNSKEKLTECPSAILSPKDMMLIENMQELIDAGVTSFKIEGRMKTPEYVAAIVKYYREAIDKALNKEKFILTKDKNDEIAQVFSRDFTSEYLYGRSGKELMNANKPNHRGVLLGRIKSYNSGKIEVLLKTNLDKGDKLSVWTTKEGRVNFKADKILLNDREVTRGKIGDVVVLDSPKRVFEGDRIFKIESIHLKIEMEKQFKEKENDELIPLKISVKAKAGEQLLLVFIDGLGNQTTVTSADRLELANKHPVTENSVKEQIRLGDTDYYLDSLIMDADPVMVPKSLLNNLRREAINNLMSYRQVTEYLKIKLEMPKNIREDSENMVPRFTVKVENTDKLKEALKTKAQYISLPMFSFQSIGDSFDSIISYISQLSSLEKDKIILELPRIIREEDLFKVKEKILSAKKYINNYLVHTLDGVQLVKELGAGNIHASSGLNIFNNYSYLFLKDKFGLKEFEYSKELNLSQLKVIAKGGQLQIFGIIELMILEHCIIGTQLGIGRCKSKVYALKDRIGAEFPIIVDNLGKNHIINNRVLMLTDEIELLKKYGFYSYNLNFTLRPKEEIFYITNLYMQFMNNKITKESLQLNLIEKVGNYTKGHYNRGVM